MGQVANTGPYAERTCGVVSEPILLHALTTYTAVVSTFDANVEAEFELFVYSSVCPITMTSA